MLFRKSIKKSLKERGYKHCASDDEFSLHGEYARNVQFAFSKEFVGPEVKIIDVIFLAADLYNERLVIGFLRENVTLENGIIQNANVNIPLGKFSLEEFEKQLDRIIPKGDPLRKSSAVAQEF